MQFHEGYVKSIPTAASRRGIPFPCCESSSRNPTPGGIACLFEAGAAHYAIIMLIVITTVIVFLLPS